MPITVITIEDTNFNLIYDLIHDKNSLGPLDYLQVMQDKRGFPSSLLQVAKNNFEYYLPQCQEELINSFKIFNDKFFPKGYLLPETEQPELQEPFVKTFKNIHKTMVDLTNSLEKIKEGDDILIIDDVCNTGRTIAEEISKLPQGVNVVAVCPLLIIPQTPEQVAKEKASNEAIAECVNNKLRNLRNKKSK